MSILFQLLAYQACNQFIILQKPQMWSCPTNREVLLHSLSKECIILSCQACNHSEIIKNFKALSIGEYRLREWCKIYIWICIKKLMTNLAFSHISNWSGTVVSMLFKYKLEFSLIFNNVTLSNLNNVCDDHSTNAGVDVVIF